MLLLYYDRNPLTPFGQIIQARPDEENARQSATAVQLRSNWVHHWSYEFCYQCPPRDNTQYHICGFRSLSISLNLLTCMFHFNIYSPGPHSRRGLVMKLSKNDSTFLFKHLPTLSPLKQILVVTHSWHLTLADSFIHSSISFILQALWWHLYEFWHSVFPAERTRPIIVVSPRL